MKLIVKGDDLGWTDGVNAGIEKAARDGILTAAGCMPNMPAAERGVKMLQKYPHVSIGQHTNVVVGRPCADPSLIPHMVEEDGTFHSSRYYRSQMKNITDGKSDVLPYYDEAVTEIRAQLTRFIEIAGQKPAYLEGHAIPSMTFEKALKDIAEEEGIIYIDMVHGGADQKYGVYQPKDIGTAAMAVFTAEDPYAQFRADVIRDIITDHFEVLSHEIARLLFHPGFADAQLMSESSFNGIRTRDCMALCSDEVKQWVKDNHIELINYYDLKEIAQ